MMAVGWWRRGRVSRSLLVLFGTIVSALSGLFIAGLWTSPAHAAGCVGNSGVTVVVDFGSLGGGAQVGCAPGDPATGFAALQNAGFGYAFVPRQPGFICQINSAPNPCNGAPTTAYWSYWHGQAGGSWSYSNSGAGQHNPAPGSVEGWSFGAGNAPGVAPPYIAPPAPPPVQSRPPAPAPPAPAPGDPGTQPANPPAPGNPDLSEQQPNAESREPGGQSSASSTHPGESAPGSTTPATSATKSQPRSRTLQAVDAPSQNDGALPVLSWVVGAVLVVLLAALSLWIVRRRAQRFQRVQTRQWP